MPNKTVRANGGAMPKSQNLTTTLLPDELPETYCMECEGTCLEPFVMDGTKLMFSRDEHYKPGDLVCLFFRPEVVKPGEHQLLVKKLVLAPPHRFWKDPSCNAGSNIKPVVIVEMLNPQKIFYIKPEALLGIHKCLGPVLAGMTTYKVTEEEIRAERAKIAASASEPKATNGTVFLAVTPTLRTKLATTVEALIGLMDEVDGDENAESTADEEPWLGWPSNGASALSPDIPTGDDREQDNSDYEDGADDEPTMGSSNDYNGTADQTRWASGSYGNSDECEDVSEDEGADINDKPQDDDEREPMLGWSETCGQGPVIGVRHDPNVQCLDGAANNEEDGKLDFRGEGYWEARKALRDRTRLTPLFTDRHAERVTIMPDGEELRTFYPLRSDHPKSNDGKGNGGLSIGDFDKLPWA